MHEIFSCGRKQFNYFTFMDQLILVFDLFNFAPVKVKESRNQSALSFIQSTSTEMSQSFQIKSKEEETY